MPHVRPATGLLLGLLLGLIQPAASGGPPPAPASEGTAACSAPERRQPLAAPAPAAPIAAPAPAGPGDYRDRITASPYGWVHLRRWCVWVEPVPAGEDAARQRDRLWLAAVEAALGHWASSVAIVRTADPEAAQVLIRRRRPPLRTEADGRPRASHGRALLRLLATRSGSATWLEPRVEVWVGPGQGARGLQATALHELGHAFGLWGHSSDGGDAMAAVPGAVPVLVPSERDRATLRWLQQQPTRIGMPLTDPIPMPPPP